MSTCPDLLNAIASETIDSLSDLENYLKLDFFISLSNNILVYFIFINDLPSEFKFINHPSDIGTSIVTIESLISKRCS